MSKLIYAQDKAGFDLAYNASGSGTGSQGTLSSINNSIAFTADGYLFTHGKFFRIFPDAAAIFTSTAASGGVTTLKDISGKSLVNINVGITGINSGNLITVSAVSTGVVSINHNTSAVSAGTYGATASSDSTIVVPKLVLDTYGHITGVTDYTATLNEVLSTDTATGTEQYLVFTSSSGAATESLGKSSTGQILKFQPSTGNLTATKFTGGLANTFGVNLNGSNTSFNNSTSLSVGPFYAPTTVGGANTILMSSGSGAPKWDLTLAQSINSGSTHIQVPTAKAVYDIVNTGIATNDAMIYKGIIDAFANPNYPAADAGWTYRITVAGKIGGASGPNVEVGDIIICNTDSTSSGDHLTVGVKWNIIQTNIDGAVVNTVVGGLKNGGIALGVGSKGIATLDTWTAGQILVAGNTNPSWITAGKLTIKGGATSLTSFDPSTTADQTISFVGAGGVTVTGSGTTVTISATADSNTATAVSNILEGSNSGTAITYAPYTTVQTKLSFDTSATAPTRTERLNLNGNFYATNLFSGGAAVLTSHQAISTFTTSYKQGTATAVQSTIYNPTSSADTLLFTTGASDGITLSGTTNAGVINIAHTVPIGAAVGSSLAQYISAVDAFGHVTGRSNFAALTIKGWNSGTSAYVDTTYAPNGASSFSIKAGTNVTTATSGSVITINSTDTNTWRNVFAYTGATGMQILSKNIDTADLAFGGDFIWTKGTADDNAGELMIGWAEISAAGIISYSV